MQWYMSCQSNLSCRRLSGVFEPGGKSGGGSTLAGMLAELDSEGFEDFDEFPAFPDLTMPLRGGI